MAGRMINGAAALAELIRPASDTDEIGVHRVLPVLPVLSGLLPGRGLRRGSTVAVATGLAAPVGGGTSLLLALLSAASQSGSWCAVVGVPALGALAAAESGIALDRLALVPNPGPDWPTVVAALIDGVDLVVTAVPGPISSSIAGRLAARARQRGSVLMPFGSWAGADLTLQVTQGKWEGLSQGHGRLRRRWVTVLAQGRGAAARPRELTMWMPGVTTPPVPVPPRGVPGPSDPAPVTAAIAAPVTAAPALTAVPSPCAPSSSVPSSSARSSSARSAPSSSPSASVLFAARGEHFLNWHGLSAVRRGASSSGRWILWGSGRRGVGTLQDRVVVRVGRAVRRDGSFWCHWILRGSGRGDAGTLHDRVVLRAPRAARVVGVALAVRSVRAQGMVVRLWDGMAGESDTNPLWCPAFGGIQPATRGRPAVDRLGILETGPSRAMIDSRPLKSVPPPALRGRYQESRVDHRPGGAGFQETVSGSELVAG